jgi:hypothetical protein
LVLHELHPDDLGHRAAAALAVLAPELAAIDARAELIAIEGGDLRVNLVRPESSIARVLLEQALLAAVPEARVSISEETIVAKRELVALRGLRP